MGATIGVADCKRKFCSPPVDEVLQLSINSMLMPPFYTREKLTQAEKVAAMDVWNLIILNKLRHFSKEKERDSNFPHTSCSDFFYDIFISRLSDIHPLVLDVINKLSDQQCRKCISAILPLLKCIDDSSKWRSSLKQYAVGLNKLGVKALECK